ncbi:hypothetical protein [Peribacillus sp. SCS-37]
MASLEMLVKGNIHINELRPGKQDYRAMSFFISYFNVLYVKIYYT